MIAVELQRMTDAGYSGTAQDLRKGRRTEIDYMTGFVAQEGKKIGVPAPMHEAVTELVKRMERGDSAPRRAFFIARTVCVKNPVAEAWCTARLCIGNTAVFARGYSSKPVRVVIAYPPCSLNDISARTVCTPHLFDSRAVAVNSQFTV